MELDTDIKENSQEKINHNSKNVMKFIKSLIFFKSHKCRHSMKSSFLNSINPALGKDLSCFFNCAFGFAQSAAKGFAIKLSLALLLALVKRKSLLKTIIGTFSKDSLSFSMYCGLLVGLYKLTICSLRAIGKTDDKVNSIIAGLVCSLSALADRSNERRQTLILYLLARTLETSVNYSNNHDIIKITRHIYYMLMAGFITYWMSCDREVLKPSVNNLVGRLTCNKPNDYVIIYLIYPEMDARKSYGKKGDFDMELYKYALSFK